MKTIICIILLCFAFPVVYCQQMDRIESKIIQIDENVSDIKDEVIKEEPKDITGQSIFEDKDGESALFLLNGGTFRLNTSDASLKLSYVNKYSDRKHFFGFDLSGKTNDDIFALFSGGNISPGAKMNGYVGIHELLKCTENLDGWILLRLGYELSSFEIYYPELEFSEQLQKTTFNGFSTSLALNFKIGGNKVMALSAGYENSNNYKDLEEYELIDQESVTDTISGLTRIYGQTSTVRIGDYATFNKIPVKYDFFWICGKQPRIGFYHFLRTSFTSEKVTGGMGSGIYLLEKKRPLSARAGIVFEISDFSKVKDGVGKSFTVNLVVGHNFRFN